MGIDDAVSRLNQATEDKAQKRREYEEQARLIVPAIHEAFVEFYHSLVKHDVTPTPIVEMSFGEERVRNFRASVAGYGWIYRGLFILTHGKFVHLPISGNWGWERNEIYGVPTRPLFEERNQPAVRQALKDVGVEDPVLYVQPGYEFVGVDWNTSLEPRFPRWDSDMDSLLAVQGLGMRLATMRSPSGELSEPGHFDDTDGKSYTPLTSAFARHIVDTKAGLPASIPQVHKPPTDVPLRPTPRYESEWQNKQPVDLFPEPKAPSGWERTKKAVIGLVVGFFMGCALGLILSVPIGLNGGGIAGPITVVVCMSLGAILGLLLGLDKESAKDS